MTKHKNHRHGDLTAPSAGKRGISVTVIIVLTVAIVAAIGAWWWAANRTNESTGPRPPMTERVTTAPAAAAAVAPKADPQRVKGRWLRPDGGYVLEVKSVDDGGRMEASYLNPRPIHVAKAEVSQDGETLKVFIELRDVNYPGSTYDLVYDPQSDSLSGIYYQAALQQRFEVVFTRMN